MSFFFFFNDTATTEIYTLSLHDALPISEIRGCRYGSRTRSRTGRRPAAACPTRPSLPRAWAARRCPWPRRSRSEEHTSELQSLAYLVCRLLLEKKKKHSVVYALRRHTHL